MRKLVTQITVIVLVVFVLLELSLAALVLSGRIELRKPGYTLKPLTPRFWADINPDFGVWHWPGASYRHVKRCFDIEYHANSAGARDVERVLVANERSRVIVIGDSFTEGYGVELNERFSDRLQALSGQEHLNFSTGGHFGTTQYYLLYKTLASRYTHDTVIVNVLPDNDFLEDDIELGKAAFPHRYRPYLVGDYPDYDLHYLNRDQLMVSRQSSTHRQLKQRVKHFFREYTWSYNAWDYMKRSLQVRQTRKESRKNAQGSEYSGFYDFTDAQFDRLRYALEKIRELAVDRNVILVTLPRASDLRRYKKQGTAPLSSRLSEFALNNRITYLDLLPGMAEHTGQWKRYYHTCDGHWNAYGHEVVANILFNNLEVYKTRENPM